jgi:hypothetical protein
MRNGNYLKRINLANNDMKNRRLHTMQKPVFFLMHESRYSFHLIMLSDLFPAQPNHERHSLRKEMSLFPSLLVGSSPLIALFIKRYAINN